jgi:hypothetical protein
MKTYPAWFISISLIILMPSYTICGQDLPRKTVTLEKLADEIFPVQDLDLNYEELYENLAQILANPIDLNRASVEEFRSLFILNEKQLEQFIRYREEDGPFLSVYELQTIPEFTPELIERLTPFVTVIDPTITVNKSLIKRILHEENNYLVYRQERTLEEKRGYRESTDSSLRYAGSPDKIYARFRVTHTGDFSFGFTAEKDAGESFTLTPSKGQWGADYISFHAQVLNKGRIKNLVVGDYQTQFGQGLLLGGGFGMGKGSESITTIRRSNLGFIPYASLNEFGFFRGVALTTTITKCLSFSSFISAVKRDGNVRSDVLPDATSLSSFSLTGFHRTPNESISRKNITEMNYGGVLNFKTKSLDAGMIFHQTNFSIPIIRPPTLYNQYAFQGDQNTNAGVFINYTLSNFTLFSEAAQTLGHGNAFILGVLGSLSTQFDMSLLYRKFDRDFYSFYSNAVSESVLPQNESGMYWGWKYTVSKKYSLSGYTDLFRFPWLRYRGYAPSNGSEWMFRFNYQPSKTVSLFFQVREESKIRNINTETTLYTVSNGIKRNYWINCDYDAGNFSLKTRAQFSTYNLGNNTTTGLALIQDVNFDMGRFSISTRYALFDCDDYDNRQYAYERDVWLAYSFPAYNGVGLRNYVMVQYKLTSKIDVWLRLAHTRYTDRDVIGAGGETIEGNTKNDIKFQARIRL